MKKSRDTRDLEAFLEANAPNLIDANENNALHVRAARADEKRRKDRALRLQIVRREKLHLSQRELAKAVGANIRTLQSWERGRQDYPNSVEILMELMEAMPNVKKRLLPPSKRKAAA
jgi:DNA-binding transcriptional regulator YiaG